MATEDDDDASKAPMHDVEGDIEFEDVSFEYNAGVPVLKNVSFTAPAGSTTALVGSSGSGKSTLISLVMAFNRPKSGTIRVDGRDLSTLKLRDYRAHLGVVLQDNFLFDGTVAENISLRAAGRDARRSAGRSAGRALRRVRAAVREEVRHRRRGAWGEGVGRPAAASRDRARHSRRPAHPDPRRGNVEPRQRERGA